MFVDLLSFPRYIYSKHRARACETNAKVKGDSANKS